MEDTPKTYKATLTITSGVENDGKMRLEYAWEPPLMDVLEEFGEDDLPRSYSFMGGILEKVVFPVIALNERYEALLLEDPEAEEMLSNENPAT